MDLRAIQEALRESGFDAWLFYDHHHRDPIAYRVLGLPENLHVTRRWYYVLPAKGDPAKLVHRIESYHLDSLPGPKRAYSAWEEQHANLREMLSGLNTIAMQYSPNNAIPYVSLVDGGTIELIRSFGKNVVSSADLVTRFEAALTEDQVASHFAARDKIDTIMEASFQEIGRRVRSGGTDEHAIQQFIMEAFHREGLVTEDHLIVAVNANSGNPHYSPTAESAQPIREGDFVLLDMWGKLDRPDSVFYDITWTGFVGKSPSDRHREIFNIVRDARDTGIKTVQSAVSAGEKIAGWQVDKATRDFIAGKGYAQYFTHRTGHSIGTSVHANGANMDNLETKDERLIIPNTCFSIEPGVYLPEFGVRAEINMIVRGRRAEVTGRVQNELVLI